MARAKRHYIPGQIWHITHRCHKREFLLKFAKDRKRKNVLINYKRLTELLGFDSYDEVRTYHRRWVEDFLGNGKNTRDDKWTKSIAVGGRSFVERVKSMMGALAIGRKGVGVGESYQLCEPEISYGGCFGGKKCDIGPKKAFFLDVIN